MKKAILLSLLFVACVFTASAQKFALIDMEYILKNIPAYEQANTQLNHGIIKYHKNCQYQSGTSCFLLRALEGFVMPSR